MIALSISLHLSCREKATVYDLEGAVTMAGALDIHSHIAGGNVNTARLMLPEQHRSHLERNNSTPFANAKWSSFETGYRYTEMGLQHGAGAGDVTGQCATGSCRTG